MQNILDQIVSRRREDITRLGVEFGFDVPEKRQRTVHPFLPEKGVILEVKRASPSKGDIAPDLDSAATARSYAEAGAAAISCLTETNYFKGTLGDLMGVCAAVDAFEAETGKPAPAVLRKDFLISAEEVEVAYRAGADAVLLIARILEKETMLQMAQTAQRLGISALIEVRKDEDLEKLDFVMSRVNHENIVCGVNSRDLKDFSIDLLIPASMLTKIKRIAPDARVTFESGILSPQSAARAAAMGFHALLLGEAAARNPATAKNFTQAFVRTNPDKNGAFWVDFAERQIGENHAARPRPLIKICGLTRPKDVLLADSLGANFVGFIFAAGFSRNVCISADGKDRFEQIIPILKNVKAKKVAVITEPRSPEAEKAAALVEDGTLDCIQLHALSYDDVPERFLSLPHYFAVTKKSDGLDGQCHALFEKGEPRFLQDSKSHEYAAENQHVWIAGGITAENVSALLAVTKAELVDVSGGIEDEATPGIKSEEKMRRFFEAAHF